ncbi:hypothetical protein LPJ56_000218 [Coemansia sp. RSA 2599]|nr:hypothetical protein LPJ56_000218 [Coemansia sp. RSA 2599]
MYGKRCDETSSNSSSSSSKSGGSNSSMELLATLGEYRYRLNEFEEAKKRLDEFVCQHRELRRHFARETVARCNDSAIPTERSTPRALNFVHALHSIINNNANVDCICWFTTVDGRDAFTVKSWSRLVELFNSAGFKVGQKLSIRKNLADYRFEKLNDRRRKAVVEDGDSAFSDNDSDDSSESLADKAGDSFFHKHFKPKNARLRLMVRRSPRKAAKAACSCDFADLPKPSPKRKMDEDNEGDSKNGNQGAATKRRKKHL